MSVSKIYIAVPTLNAERWWRQFSPALNSNLEDLGLDRGHVLVVDSESTDATAELARSEGYRVQVALRKDFDHGATRQAAADVLVDADVLVYLTQDAVLASPQSIRNLVAPLLDGGVGLTYGRQLPRIGATFREQYGRYFSYPDKSVLRDMSMSGEGFRSISASNSFCAYRRADLMAVGGFPLRTICSEEVLVVAKMHLHGLKTAYVAEATVLHSHDYTISEEFQRYFDIGTCHSRESGLLCNFSGPGGDGVRFVLGEIKFLLKHQPLAIPGSLVRTVSKLLAYRLGKAEWLSNSLRRKLSMNSGFWDKEKPGLSKAKRPD